MKLNLHYVDPRLVELYDRAKYTVNDSPFGRVEEWLEMVGEEKGIVHLKGYIVFRVTGEVLIGDSTLRFRSLDEMTQSLGKAGFSIEQVCGDWRRGPFVSTSLFMVIIARRN